MTERRPYRPRGSTDKPCPGCGGTALRPTHGVCSACRAALDLVTKLKAEQQDSDAVVLYASDVAYGLPYIHHSDRAGSGGSKIERAFHALERAVSRPTEQHPPPSDDYASRRIWDYGHSDSGGHCSTPRLYPSRAVADGLRSAYAAANDAAQHAYRKGCEEGQNLLMQLADGSITADAFNDQATRQRGEGRR